MKRSSVALAAIALACGFFTPSSAAPSVHPGTIFNPQSKAHAVSRSTFHTEQGRVYDTHRAYEGMGQSHVEHALSPREVNPSLARHMWEDEVHSELTDLALKNFGPTVKLTTVEDAASGMPEQVKMSITARLGEMVINWLTWNVSTTPMVKYGVTSGEYTSNVTAQTVNFVDPNPLHLMRYIHNALIVGLPASTYIYYVVGDAASGVWTDEMRFITQPDEKVQTIAVFGDLGVVNSQSMQQLSDEVANGEIDMLWQLGDYAYNMDELQGMTGDVFLEELSNMTQAVPFMGCPGNHEQAYNFSHFQNKFSHYNYANDPSGPFDSNWYYSWDFMSGGSRVHVIAIDSELYFWDYASVTEEQKHSFLQGMEAQWNWIRADLIAAYDSGKYDWIFAYSHRPLYCSNVDDVPDCTNDAHTLRDGIPGPQGPNGTLLWGIEEALSVRPIDIYFSAHEHSYERTLPVYNGTIDFQPNTNVYVDPKYPMMIISGSAGCREFFNYYDSVFYGAWSVYRSASYGYGHLTIHNSTHLYWDQLIDEGRGGKDTMWIVKKGKKKVFHQPTAVEEDDARDFEPIALE